jgi:hypothetical protein
MEYGGRGYVIILIEIAFFTIIIWSLWSLPKAFLPLSVTDFRHFYPYEGARGRVVD